MTLMNLRSARFDSCLELDIEVRMLLSFVDSINMISPFIFHIAVTWQNRSQCGILHAFGTSFDVIIQVPVPSTLNRLFLFSSLFTHNRCVVHVEFVDFSITDHININQYTCQKKRFTQKQLRNICVSAHIETSACCFD